MKEPADKEQRLRAKADIGERLRLFYEDPAIIAWFRQAEQDLISQMIDAAPEDDEKPRGARLQLKAMKALWLFIGRAASEGKHAMQELDRIAKKKDIT